MKKRLLGILLAVVTAVNILPMGVSATESIEDASWGEAKKIIEQCEPNIEDEAFLKDYPSLSDTAITDIGDNRFYERESNNSMGLADLIKNDYTVTASVSGYDLDYFEIVLTKRSQIMITTIADRSTLGMMIKDSGDNALQVATSLGYNGSSWGYGITITLNAGTYYLIALDTEMLTNGYMFYVEITPTQPVHTHAWKLVEYDLDTEYAYYECSCGQTKSDKIYIDQNALVYRLCGSTRYDTAFKTADCLKEVMGVSKFDAVVVATGKNFADALSGSYLAYVNDAPILLTNGKNIDDVRNYIKKNVKIGGTVYLLGGTGAVPNSMESDMDSYEVIRLAGSNRYETNLLILEEAGIIDQELVVCTGKNYADSLSASAVKKPILLVKTNITREHEALIQENDVENFYIIGGTGAVSERVQRELETYGVVDRIFGSTRYETSAEVAEYFFEYSDAAVLAYGKNFPDGLCGGPFACSLNGPLILTATEKTSSAKAYTKAYSIEQGYVLGGTGLISDAATRTIFGKSSNNTILLY